MHKCNNLKRNNLKPKFLTQFQQVIVEESKKVFIRHMFVGKIQQIILSNGDGMPRSCPSPTWGAQFLASTPHAQMRSTSWAGSRQI